MINIYDNTRFISKKTLYTLAGVHRNTFTRYLQSRREVLEKMGVSPKARLLPPAAVRYICEDYCIDLPDELQAPESIDKSELYRRFLYELQKTSLFIFALTAPLCTSDIWKCSNFAFEIKNENKRVLPRCTGASDK